MDYIHKYVTNIYRHRKLFSALADESLFLCLSCLDLATNELPKEASRFMCRALTNHKFIVLPDEGGYNFKYFYATSFSFCFSCITTLIIPHCTSFYNRILKSIARSNDLSSPITNKTPIISVEINKSAHLYIPSPLFPKRNHRKGS